MDCYVPCVLFRKLNSMKLFDIQIANRINGLMQICELPTVHQADIAGIDFNIANPEVLLMIKRVHMEFTDKWLKNVNDYIFLSKKGIKPNKKVIRAFNTRINYFRRVRTLKHKKGKVFGSENEIGEQVEQCKLHPITAAKVLLDRAGVKLIDWIK